MTKKQIFLDGLKKQIDALQAAYHQNSLLPDFFFEGLSFGPEPSNQPEQNGHTQINTQTERKNNQSKGLQSLLENIDDSLTTSATEYGQNRRWIEQMLNSKQVALTKNDLIKLFMEDTFVSANEAYRAVTNALSGLSDTGVVVGCKPTSFKMKGNFWAFKDWFDGNNLKPEYVPKNIIGSLVKEEKTPSLLEGAESNN